MTDFSAKYDPGVQVDADDVLCLHRNENLFAGPEWTVDAARACVEKAAIASYPDATSLPLREALGELYGVGPERVFVGNGSDEVLADLLSLLGKTHDAVHCLDVCFKVYPMLAERLDLELRTLPGNAFETGRIETANFRGLALVDSPNGITGRSVDPSELMALADRSDSFLIWDNVYGEYAGHSIPSPLPANVAFVRSFSKFYALAGLRVGYCIADKALVAEMLARKDAFNVNGFGQVMAIEAIRRRSHFEEMKSELLACKAELVRGLEELGFDVPPSDFVAVLASHSEHDAEHVQSALLARKIAVRRFASPPTASFVRITVPPRRELARLLDALADLAS